MFQPGWRPAFQLATTVGNDKRTEENMHVKTWLKALTIAAFGCGGESPQPLAAERTEAALSEQDEIAGDESSPTAIELHWEDPSSERGGASFINAIVENTTDHRITVDLSLVAIDQTDEARESVKNLGSRSLAGGSSTQVKIPIARIPVQTAGGDTPVRVRAAYTIQGRDPLADEDRTWEHSALSEPRWVTFATDFRAADVRDHRAQLAHNNRLIRSGSEKRVTHRKVLDRATGQMRAAQVTGVNHSFSTVPQGPAMPPPFARGQGGQP
ncbi:MAG: hypothetical protein OXU20_35940 [Myxococcales bacterium]|nr:hypothetical protein [Myxococcales bacterium]